MTVVTETADAVPTGSRPPPPASTPERSFGEEGARLTYGSYLRITELLEQQRLESDPPAHDELLFITVHQVYELWFQQMLHELDESRRAMSEGRLWWAQHLLRRVRTIETVLIAQIAVLESMTPQDFLEFRAKLAPASGFQSVQFRELEVLSGLRDEQYLKGLEVLSDDGIPPAVTKRLGQRSLAEAHAHAAARLGITDWAGFYADPGPNGVFYVVCESLVDYDERWIRWRNEHVTLVERTLGPRTRGTAGTAISYLQRTTRYRYFPQLWELRNDLSVRGGGELVE